jgi:hypothetical protein
MKVMMNSTPAASAMILGDVISDGVVCGDGRIIYERHAWWL